MAGVSNKGKHLLDIPWLTSFSRLVVSCLVVLFLGGSSLSFASTEVGQLKYQERILDLASSTRKLSARINELDKTHTGHAVDQLSVYLENPIGERAYWSDVELILDGVTLSSLSPTSSNQQNSSAKTTWNSFVSSGKHDLEIIFTGKDKSGKYVELTKRTTIIKQKGAGLVHIVKYPVVSNSLVGRKKVERRIDASVSAQQILDGAYP